MVSACVLVYCHAGEFPTALESIRRLEGVKRAFSVLGRCDLVADVEAADIKALGDVIHTIATSRGAMATETLVEALI